MNGRRLWKCGWIATAIAASLTLGAPAANANLKEVYVTLTGFTMLTYTARVASVTGGVTTGGKSVPTPNGALTTASISVPLVMTAAEPDPNLLEFAAVEIANPNAAQSPQVLAQTYEQRTMGVWDYTEEQRFVRVIPIRVDIPGTFGSTAQRGSFVVTANVLSSVTNVLATPIRQNPPTLRPPSPYPTYWAVHLNGLTAATKEMPDGYFTFEPFSLATQQTSLALTLHSNKVTLADLTNWTKAHPNGLAMIEWKQATTSGYTVNFSVSLKNVVLTATNDASSQPAITAHLTSTIGQIITP